MAPSHYGAELDQVTRCYGCGMVFTNPQLLSYEQQVENTGVLTRHLMPERLRSAELQASLQLALVGRYSNPGRLLDFGCGSGALVHAAIDQGWQATGLDLNRGLVNAANQHWGTIALMAGSLDEFLERTQQHFEAIVSNQVFEHLRDPVTIGTKLVSRLNAGGLILVDVPNVNQPQ
jgi:2-polyprenyl-3-methyl-5-hydroxy-6-metoxy-1,4-benzoquinol methylase